MAVVCDVARWAHQKAEYYPVNQNCIIGPSVFAKQVNQSGAAV